MKFAGIVNRAVSVAPGAGSLQQMQGRAVVRLLDGFPLLLNADLRAKFRFSSDFGLNAKQRARRRIVVRFAARAGDEQIPKIRPTEDAGSDVRCRQIDLLKKISTRIVVAHAGATEKRDPQISVRVDCQTVGR